MNYKNKEILITGGAGFIGSHIAEKLVNLEAKVTILDNLSTGFLENIENFKNQINFIEGDISDTKTCLNATKNKEIIFHLAAFISVPQSLKQPEICHKVNVDGTFNILHAAKINKVKRLIFSSSSAVYGTTEKTCDEGIYCSPESPYGSTKLIGEYYCKMFSSNFDLETVILRYFNVYGPRQNPNGEYAAVVSKFKNLILKNHQITIFGDGKQTRDFTPVAEVVKANLTVGQLPSKKVNNKIFNVATGKSINLLELIDLLKQENPNYNKEVLFQPARIGDIKFSSANNSKLKAIL